MSVETPKCKSKRGRRPASALIAKLTPEQREALRRLAIDTRKTVREIDAELGLGALGVGRSLLEKHVRALRLDAGLWTRGRRGRKPIGMSVADLPRARREELRRLALSTGIGVNEIDRSLRLGELGVGISALGRHIRRLRREAGLVVPGRRGPESINLRVARIAAAKLSDMVATFTPDVVEAILRRMLWHIAVNPDEVTGTADKPESVT